MSSMTVKEGLVAVYDRPNAPFEQRLFPIREPRPGEVLETMLFRVSIPGTNPATGGPNPAATSVERIMLPRGS